MPGLGLNCKCGDSTFKTKNYGDYGNYGAKMKMEISSLLEKIELCS